MQSTYNFSDYFFAISSIVFIFAMNLEKAIEKLSEDDLSDLREWFYKFDNEVWDTQFQSDVTAGKLDR